MAQPAGSTGAPVVKIICKPGSAQAHATRDFLQRCGIPFQSVEVRSDKEARAAAGVESLDNSRLPVCIFPDGTRMESPTLRQIIEKLGWFSNPSRPEPTSRSTAPVPRG